ncbi:hypothetical protein E1211_08140 [Micromonospora sp. 15K316]|uniref:DUF6518 family protein n=1 Tax=Micromonospora sp. 15K316 TaxID=2530376 RepID=UPI0010505E44|nr:DUF6518 family protein [Micromonospora sp. 15K316]TDC38151.1 hypothetical protein E1211_08140 [Micromonospora sp. 15K316]
MQPDRRTAALVTPVAGFLLGFLDFVWIKWVPYPFAELGNSTATWAIAAFVLGYWIRSGWLRAALGAVALLVVAVPSYYVAAALLQGDSLAAVWAPTSLVWMLFGVLAGTVFGIGGAWARATGWRGILGTALPAAALFEEAARFVGKVEDPHYPSGAEWNIAIDAALGVLAVVLIGRSNRRRALALVAALPLALVIFVGFTLAGGF